MSPVAARKIFQNLDVVAKGLFVSTYGPTAGNHYDDDHVMLEMHDSLAGAADIFL